MVLNKKGQGLQISTVILIILALLVLVIVAVVVTGGFTEFAEKIGFIKKTAFSTDEAKLKCQNWCNSNNKDKFCDGTFQVNTETGQVYESNAPATGTTVYFCGPDSLQGGNAGHFGVSCPGLC